MPNADARLNMRIHQDTLDRLREAARLQSTDVTSFVISAAVAQARRVLLEERALRLTPEEISQVARVVSEDREPTETLILAAKHLERSEVGQHSLT
jgi:uncharacterized protein (DUF1778 family)